MACQAATEKPYPAPHFLERASTLESEADAGVFTTSLVSFPDARQEDPSWCWAACAEMILRFADEPTTQEAVALRIHGEDEYGEAKRQGANLHEIFCALNPDLERRSFELMWAGLGEQVTENPELLLDPRIDFSRSSIAKVMLDEYAPQTVVAVEDLRHGYPAVVGLRDPERPAGHAYVLVGAEYTVDETGDLGSEAIAMFNKGREAIGLKEASSEESNVEQLVDRVDGERFPATQVTLVDPWTGERVTLGIEDFAQRVDFVISRRDARETLLEWQQVAELKAGS